MSSDTTVHFVKQQNASGELLEKTFQEATNCGNCVWIEEAACLKITERQRKSVFIFDKFEGVAFEHIIKTGNRIYGPLVILYYVQNAEILPKMNHPVHNLSMKKFIISCTSMEKTGRETIHRYIQWMCGEVSKDFHDKVTHLVAGEVGSKKYLVAASLKKRIMTPEWVQQCWKDSQTTFTNPESDLYEQYRCKVFTGCVITVSGLDTSERAEVRDVVEKEGGRYTGEMKINECTHLIINHPKGQKYEFARKWRIHIVQPVWLFDSVDAGYCIDTHKYKLSPDELVGDLKLTSTPQADTSHNSLAPDLSCISVANINETAMNQTLPQRTADPTQLDALDLSKVKAMMFLDGCKLFLSGFAGSRLEKLRKLINLGGGTRFSQINETISHVVMGDRIQEHIKQLQQGQFRLSVVSAEWLVACAHNGGQVSEEPFLCLDLPAVVVEEEAVPVTKVRSSIAMYPPPAVDPDRTIGPDDMQELLSQYLPAKQDTTDESALVRAVEAVEQRPPTQDDEEMTQDPTQETQDGALFAGKKFALVGLSLDEERELTSVIEEADGLIVGVKSRTVADYAVVPIFGCHVPITATEIVTMPYIQICLETEEMPPVNQHPMFTPLTFRGEGCTLDGCVLSISGYTGVERDVLMHVAEMLGAKCQEYFVKQAKRGLQASTHLVVNCPAGSKYMAAKKWKLPTVQRQWLFECARTGKRLSEEPFLVDRPQEESVVLIKSRTPPPAPPGGAIVTPKGPTTPVQKTDTIKHGPGDKENLLKEMPVAAASAAIIVPVVPSRTETNVLPNQRVKALITQGNQATPARQAEDDRAGIDTPGKFLKPGIEFMPKFDYSDFIAALDTPENIRLKNHARKQSLPLGEQLEANMAMALKNSFIPQKNTGTPAPRRDLVNQSVFEGPSGPLKGIVIAVSKKLSGQQSDINNMAADLGAEYRWTYDQSCTHFIFQGRRSDTSKEFKTAREHRKLIVSPHWIIMCKEQNAHVDESLFPHDFNPSRSLSVTSVKKESPSHLSTRRSTRSRLKTDETASPSLPRTTRGNSKLGRAVDLTIDDSHPEKEKPPKSPIKRLNLEEDNKKADDNEESTFARLDKTCSDDDLAVACAVVEQEVPSATQPANTLAREAFVDDITSLMAATKTLGKRRSRRSDCETPEEPETKRMSLSRSSNKSEDSDTHTPRGSNKERRTRSSLRGRTNKTPAVNTETSQMVEVIWDDPQTRRQQEKLAAELAKNSESFSPPPVEVLSDEDLHAQTTDAEPVHQVTPAKAAAGSPLKETTKTETPERPSLAIPTALIAHPAAEDMMEEEIADPDKTTDQLPTVFLFSGMSQQERTDYADLVEQLGGRVSDASHYDATCTHLIVGCPTRNEKYLACVAAGKWVLHKSYLEACRQQKCFVQEDDHEWGSEATQGILNGQASNVAKLALAAHRWRSELTEGTGAFSKWVCVLLTEKKKEDGLVRLLLAGGATVRATRPPFSNLEDLNFAFLDLGKVKQKVDVDALQGAGVHCVKPDYIASYLMDDPPPRPRQFYIAEVTSATSEGCRKRRPSGTGTPDIKRTRRH